MCVSLQGHEFVSLSVHLHARWPSWNPGGARARHFQGSVEERLLCMKELGLKVFCSGIAVYAATTVSDEAMTKSAQSLGHCHGLTNRRPLS